MLKHCNYLLPEDRGSGFCLIFSEQTTAAQQKNYHQAKNAAKRSPNHRGIPLKQRSQEPKAIANGLFGLIPAPKEPHKGNKLNCSRKYIILDNYGLGGVRWGESSEEGNYGVNAEKQTKRSDQVKRREPSACFTSNRQNLSLRITTVSANNKVLYNTNNNRKWLISVYQTTR